MALCVNESEIEICLHISFFEQCKVMDKFCGQCTVDCRESSRDVISVAVNHSFQRTAHWYEAEHETAIGPFIRQMHDGLSGDFVAVTFHLTLAIHSFLKN